MADRLGRAAAGLVVMAALLAGACSGDDGGEADEDDGPLTTLAPTPATVPEVPAASAAGTGMLVIGRSTHAVTVTDCTLTPDPAAPEGARALLVISGTGTTEAGVGFTVEVQRFATSLNEVVTYTDTIAYTDAARILQAQRVEVAGQITDLRDPDASSALLRPRADGVSGAGLAGPPGGDAEEGGLVGVALDLTCG